MIDEDLVTMIYIVAYSTSNSIMIILFGFGFRNEMNIRMSYGNLFIIYHETANFTKNVHVCLNKISVYFSFSTTYLFTG